MPLLAYLRTISRLSKIILILTWVQVISTLACVGLSLWRLITQDYGEVEEGNAAERNREGALMVFYSTALAEEVLCLVETLYWIFKIFVENLLQRVSDECGFGSDGHRYVCLFFFDAYSRCINGSIIDRLKIDLSLSQRSFWFLISRKSNSLCSQIVQTLLPKVFEGEPSEEMIERLIAMLNWKDPADAEIRLSAAEILSKLKGTQPLPRFRCHGSLRKHDNRGKIWRTPGLLPKIIDLIGHGEKILRNQLTAAQTTALSQSLYLRDSLPCSSYWVFL
ncbi:unnamed protein product [Spirodela intermedia]|uniref:Uncharacterized protein n=1 Tax=Spirodela intermedia TaxID=51605 RepID=A0ABN7ECI0_SPIIN|nr:unnamed protein product [Spirodela intermedia]